MTHLLVLSGVLQRDSERTMATHGVTSDTDSEGKRTPSKSVNE